MRTYDGVLSQIDLAAQHGLDLYGQASEIEIARSTIDMDKHVQVAVFTIFAPCRGPKHTRIAHGVARDDRENLVAMLCQGFGGSHDARLTPPLRRFCARSGRWRRRRHRRS